MTGDLDPTTAPAGVSTVAIQAGCHRFDPGGSIGSTRYLAGAVPGESVKFEYLTPFVVIQNLWTLGYEHDMISRFGILPTPSEAGPQRSHQDYST